MKKFKQTCLRSARVIGAMLLLLMIVGSIWDLPISKFLYPGRESSFGQFFAAFGELPAFLAMTGAGVLLFFNRKRLRASWNVLFLAASLLLCASLSNAPLKSRLETLAKNMDLRALYD